MTLQKAPLAAAIAAALTLSAQTHADVTYTGSPIVINTNISEGVVIEGQTINDTLDIDIQQSEVGDGVIISNSSVSSAYIENNQGVIYAGTSEPLNEESLPTGNVGVLIQDSTVTGIDAEDVAGVKVLLSNNGGSIQASTDSAWEEEAPAVVIDRSNVTGSIINENSGSQGGAIEGVEGIFIGESTFNGNIYNLDDVEISQATIDAVLAGPDDSSLNAVSVIAGRDSGILIYESAFTGDIENSGHIAGERNDGISIENATFSGNVVNDGTIKGGKAGVASHGLEESEEYNESNGTYSANAKATQAKFTGDIINNGEISADYLAGIELGGVEFDGRITNDGTINGGDAGIIITGAFEGSLQGTYDAESGIIDAEGTYETTLSNINANIINNGDITSNRGAGIEVASVKMTGSIVNTGSIDSEYGVVVIGGERGTLEFTGTDESYTETETATEYFNSTFNGEINNSGTIDAEDTGIFIENTAFNGTINNTGTITGGLDGIYIDDSVTGRVVINQSAGTINGGEYAAIRLSNATRVNYTGGQINGLIENDGGTFHVEGHQVISGDYEQQSNATLSLGLHTETSLTANNITLAEGSKVLIDLSKGNLYVQDGETVELLRTTGGDVVNTGVVYDVTSTLVTVAEAKLNASGNLELTFDRASFMEAADNLSDTGEVTGQEADNIQQLAQVLQQLDDIAAEVPEVAALLNSISGDATSFNSLLPDLTGSIISSAMSASNMSNGQVSVRARSLASGDTFTKTGLWVQALAADAEQDERDGIAGYDADTLGFVLGLDGELSNGSVVGAAYSFTNTDTDSATSSSDTDYHMLTGYWGQSYGNVLVDGQVYYAWGDNSSRRAIGATADYDSKLYGARIGTGYQLDLGNDAQLIPTLSLDYSRLSVDGYTETGTGAQIIQGEDYDRLELGLSGELNKTFQINDMLVTPRLTLGVYHDFEAEAQSVTAAFAAAPTSTFTVTGAEPEDTRYTAGFGVQMLKGESFSADVEYNYNWQDDFDAHTGALKLRWEF